MTTPEEHMLAMKKVQVSDAQFDLVEASGFEIVRYADLPPHHRRAIAWFMAMDNELWPMDGSGATIPMDEIDAYLDELKRTGINPRHALFEESLADFVSIYGDMEFGVVRIDTDALKARVVDNIQASDRLKGMDWDAYQEWYLRKAEREGDGRLREWPKEDRWPVFLSAAASAVMDDGWHRFHSYVRSGHADIPAVFLPSERHYQHLRDHRLPIPGR